LTGIADRIRLSGDANTMIVTVITVGHAITVGAPPFAWCSVV